MTVSERATTRKHTLLRTKAKVKELDLYWTPLQPKAIYTKDQED